MPYRITDESQVVVFQRLADPHSSRLTVDPEEILSRVHPCQLIHDISLEGKGTHNYSETCL